MNASKTVVQLRPRRANDKITSVRNAESVAQTVSVTSYRCLQRPRRVVPGHFVRM